MHGPADLTWTEAAAALSTATGVPIKAQQITGDEQRAALRDAGMSEVAVEGIVGMNIGKREGFTPEQPRSLMTTTPGTLAGWAITHLRPALGRTWMTGHLSFEQAELAGSGDCLAA